MSKNYVNGNLSEIKKNKELIKKNFFLKKN